MNTLKKRQEKHKTLDFALGLRYNESINLKEGNTTMKALMKPSTIQWHLVRDNCLSLAKFCDKNRTEQNVTKHYKVEEKGYFTIKYLFNNGGFIEAELRAGDETRGYTVADHFQVVDYAFGS